MEIILEDNKFLWTQQELKRFAEMWNEDESLGMMAMYLKCKKVDIALLVIDQAEKGKIKPRKTGLY